MDHFEKSLELLRKHLVESTVEERSQLWAEIMELGISGPSIDQYLESVQEQSSRFNSSISGALEYNDDIQHAAFYKQLFRGVTMESTLCVQNKKIVLSYGNQTCDAGSKGIECVYAFAA